MVRGLSFGNHWPYWMWRKCSHALHKPTCVANYCKFCNPPSPRCLIIIIVNFVVVIIVIMNVPEQFSLTFSRHTTHTSLCAERINRQPDETTHDISSKKYFVLDVWQTIQYSTLRETRQSPQIPANSSSEHTVVY